MHVDGKWRIGKRDCCHGDCRLSHAAFLSTSRHSWSVAVGLRTAGSPESCLKRADVLRDEANAFPKLVEVNRRGGVAVEQNVAGPRRVEPDEQQFPAKKSVCSLDRWLGV